MTSGSDAPAQHIALAWSIKASFHRYVSEAGSISVGAGAADRDGRFFFPLARSEVDGAARSHHFAGEVHFTAHGGALSVVVADPWIVEDSTGVSVTIRSDHGDRLVFAVLDAFPSVLDSAGEATATAAVNVRLSDQGAALFDFMYAPGSSLDPLAIELG
jgi:hypothetical protein